MKELYKKYRPKSLNRVIGQAKAVKLLQGLFKKDFPHCILLSGPSGCGKTTLAHIAANMLGIENPADFMEINAADFNGVATVREVRSRMKIKPMFGDRKVWLFDECHKLSKDAQNALLKMTEDTPDHVYFFFATTEPDKLIRTLRGRCSKIELDSVSVAGIASAIKYVLKKEKLEGELPEDLIKLIAKKAEGSVREALVILDQVLVLEGEEEQRDFVESITVQQISKFIGSMLMDPRSDWNELRATLKKSTDDPESIRRGVLGYCNTILLSGGKLAARAYVVMDSFREPYFNTGKAGLSMSCYEVFFPGDE